MLMMVPQCSAVFSKDISCCAHCRDLLQSPVVDLLKLPRVQFGSLCGFTCVTSIFTFCCLEGVWHRPGMWLHLVLVDPLHELGVEYTESTAVLAKRISSRAWLRVDGPSSAEVARASGPGGPGRGGANSWTKDQSVLLGAFNFGGLRWGLGVREELRVCVRVCVCV